LERYKPFLTLADFQLKPRNKVLSLILPAIYKWKMAKFLALKEMLVKNIKMGRPHEVLIVLGKRVYRKTCTTGPLRF